MWRGLRDDFARDHRLMLTNGVIFEETPRHEPYGTVAVFKDPFGNRWDLIEFKEEMIAAPAVDCETPSRAIG